MAFPCKRENGLPKRRLTSSTCVPKALKTITKMKFLWNINNIGKFTSIARISGHGASQCSTLSKEMVPRSKTAPVD